MVGLAPDINFGPAGLPIWRTPLITLKAGLLYPGRRLPLHLQGEKYNCLLADARANDSLIAMGTERDDIPGAVYEMVGVGKICDSLAYADGVHVTIEGITRGRILQQQQDEDYLVAMVAPVTEMGLQEEVEEEAAGLLRELGQIGPFGRRDWRRMPLGEVADLVNAHLPQSVEKRQEVFEILDVASRLRQVRKLLSQTRDQRFPGRFFVDFSS